MNNSKKAFTLAEVLIVVGIIGIVAQMTIPTLMQNVSNAQFIAGLKKAASSLSQVSLLLQNDSGDLESAFGTNVSWTQDQANSAMMNAVASKLRVQKICDSGTGAGVCWDAAYYNLLKNPAPTATWTDGSTSIILNDGSLMAFQYVGNCTLNTSATGPLAGLYCGVITVDVNGFKLPNTVGRDIFMFAVGKNGIYPGGAYNSFNAYCDPNDTTHNIQGAGCAYKILIEGGMNY